MFLEDIEEGLLLKRFYLQIKGRCDFCENLKNYKKTYLWVTLRRDPAIFSNKR